MGDAAGSDGRSTLAPLNRSVHCGFFSTESNSTGPMGFVLVVLFFVRADGTMRTIYSAQTLQL
jgi:hypothetical protein